MRQADKARSFSRRTGRPHWRPKIPARDITPARNAGAPAPAKSKKTSTTGRESTASQRSEKPRSLPRPQKRPSQNMRWRPLTDKRWATPARRKSPAVVSGSPSCTPSSIPWSKAAASGGRVSSPTASKRRRAAAIAIRARFGRRPAWRQEVTVGSSAARKPGSVPRSSRYPPVATINPALIFSLVHRLTRRCAASPPANAGVPALAEETALAEVIVSTGVAVPELPPKTLPRTKRRCPKRSARGDGSPPGKKTSQRKPAGASSPSTISTSRGNRHPSRHGAGRSAIHPRTVTVLPVKARVYSKNRSLARRTPAPRTSPERKKQRRKSQRQRFPAGRKKNRPAPAPRKTRKRRNPAVPPGPPADHPARTPAPRAKVAGTNRLRFTPRRTPGIF